MNIGVEFGFVVCGGEKFSYPIPTYQALKGIIESVYWKPTLIWIIDSVRIMKPIKTRSKGMRPIKLSGLHRYKRVVDGVDAKGRTRYVPVCFTGAPSTRDIIDCLYGERADDKLRASIAKRLLPCITEKARLPWDIMKAAFNRANNTVAMDKWMAEKTLSIACSLICKHYNVLNNAKKEGVWKLDSMIDNRDYLFGRALAYARRIEENAQWRSGNEARQTNAERLQLAFSQHPARTWKILEEKLLPYLNKIKGGSNMHAWESAMREIIARIGVDDFNNEPLGPIYLLGYSSQLNELRKSKKPDDKTHEEERDNEYSE